MYNVELVLGNFCYLDTSCTSIKVSVFIEFILAYKKIEMTHLETKSFSLLILSTKTNNYMKLMV